MPFLTWMVKNQFDAYRRISNRRQWLDGLRIWQVLLHHPAAGETDAWAAAAVRLAAGVGMKFFYAYCLPATSPPKRCW